MLGEEGNDHLQGYIECGSPQSLRWLKRNIHNGAHFEPRRGNADQARAYAMKDDTRVDGPWEIGTWNEPLPGKRSDLDKIHSDLIARRPLAEIVSNNASSLRILRNLVAAEALLAPRRTTFDPDVKIHVYWGAPGTGKTRRAYEKAGDDYHLKDPTNKWWDGYRGQHTVIVDDYGGDNGGSKWPITLFKQWADKHPLVLEIKGGVTHANWKLLIFTSNHDPANWYFNEERAVMRRLDKIVYFGDDLLLQVKYPDI